MPKKQLLWPNSKGAKVRYMSPTPLLTIEMLKAKGCCQKQLEIFTNEWPHGAPITLENIKRARALNLNLNWLKDAFLTPTALAKYAQIAAVAFLKFKQIQGSALDEYRRIKEWKKYEHKQTTICDCGSTTEKAWKEYEAVQAAAWEVHNRTMDPIFLTALIMSINTTKRGKIKNAL